MEQNQEFEIEKLFRDKLESHGYPTESIVRLSNNMELPGDIAIKNGQRYIQCFELKAKFDPKLQRKYFSQYVSVYKVQLPVYVVTQEKDDIVFYDKDSIGPLDIESVLNYEKATDAFVETAKKELNKEKSCVKKLCYLLSVLFFISDIVFFLKSMCDSSYCIATIAFAILMLLSCLIPFSKNFEVKVGDLGLNLTFKSEDHKCSQC